MPLLRKSSFVRSSSCEGFRDDDAVFHCQLTDEIFKDYEEYCERIILVNSMVWSCEMTGRPNLTYSEALASERRARRSLRDFPHSLRMPVVYLAARTKRCTFAEAADDVYMYVRDRYFAGETVEACFCEGATSVWCEAHVLTVDVTAAGEYLYELERPDESGGPGQTAFLAGERVRRNRSAYTREKNKLYLKQFIDYSPNGIVKVKESVLQKYNIGNVDFTQIFAGSPPNFPSSKKFDKLVNTFQNGTPNRKTTPRQETIAKYMTKTDKFDGQQQSASTIPDRLGNENGLKFRSSMKQRKEEEKLKKREKTLKFAAYVKEWNKLKDDLELVDHKSLPPIVPVDIPGVPNKYFGDFVAILEFFLEFYKQLRVRDILNRVDYELLRRALTAKEVAGPLNDLLQILLGAIFSLQEEEAEEYSDSTSYRILNGMNFKPEEGDLTVTRGVQLATISSKWCKTYLATPLNKLSMEAQTISEILRLHLLTSGNGLLGEQGTKWRYQQRGGYNPEDDPGLLLKIKEPHILRALSHKHVSQLPVSYKIKIIRCLINQILTYATIRDVIEEKQEEIRNVKFELRSIQIAERKREAEYILARQKIKKEMNVKKLEGNITPDKSKALFESTADQLETLKKEADQKKAEFEKKYKNLYSQVLSSQNCLGLDRAFRRYWVFESMEGLFVEYAEELSGVCLDKPVIPNPALAAAPPEDTLNYVQKLFESELNGGCSDKENDSNNISPRKSNGWSMAGSLPESKVNLLQDLFMCTSNQNTCPVHLSSYPKVRWSFFAKSEDLKDLIGALNKRGVRENDLKKHIAHEEEHLEKCIAKSPFHILNPDQFPPQLRVEVQTKLSKRYADANFNFPPSTDVSEVLEMALRDNILDLEEKLHLGGLGELHVDNRDTWRDTLNKRGYDKQCSSLVWGPKKSTAQKYEDQDVDEEVVQTPVLYQDPGCYLNNCDEINSDVEEELCQENCDSNPTFVKSLASALLQIGQAVNHKHLKRPLGYDEKERTRENAKSFMQFDALKRWELSLMESSSYAQVMLHLLTLENSILWSRSILNANCRICRKKSDDENMLLCDSCNKGHHIYCLKPKLTKIPKGDWFCDQCKPKEKSPQKINRRVFKEEDSGDEVDDDKSWNSSVETSVCAFCKSGGSLIQCTECEKGWHAECLPRPLQRKGGFVCMNCVRQSKQDKEWDPRVRRCAADAMNNIDHYKKMLKRSPQQHSDSESSEENLAVKSRKKKLSKGNSPDTNNQRSKRSRRSAPTDSNHNSESDEPLVTLQSHKPSKDSSAREQMNGVVKKSARLSENASSKRNSAPSANGYVNGVVRSTRRSEAIHSVLLEELLNDIFRHKDSWPFNAPVTIEEVPDYFDIITNPMDFGTIKVNLENKKYNNDLEFMSDAALVFENCYRYNHDDDAVAKAGLRLQKFFQKRCKELNLITLPVFESDQPDVKRIKVDN